MRYFLSHRSHLHLCKNENSWKARKLGNSQMLCSPLDRTPIAAQATPSGGWSRLLGRVVSLSPCMVFGTGYMKSSSTLIFFCWRRHFNFIKIPTNLFYLLLLFLRNRRYAEARFLFKGNNVWTMLICLFFFLKWSSCYRRFTSSVSIKNTAQIP